MATYGSIYSPTNAYSTISTAGSYGTYAGFTESPSMWADIYGVDPMATSMLRADPVFFDALYEQRMVEYSTNMTWQRSTHRLSRGTGYGVGFGGDGTINRICYSSYLDNYQMRECTISFVYKANDLSHQWLGTLDSKRIFYLMNNYPLEFSIVSFPRDGSSTASNAEATLGWYATGAGTGALPIYVQGGTRVNDGNLHLVSVTFDSRDANSTQIVLYIDGIAQSTTQISGWFPNILTEFGIGVSTIATLTGLTPNTGSNASVSHLAIHDRLIPQSQLRAWVANIDIPDDGGYYTLADGAWRQFLL
jgi:hypothetical protein